MASGCVEKADYGEGVSSSGILGKWMNWLL